MNGAVPLPLARSLVLQTSVVLQTSLAHAAPRQRLCATAVAEWATAVEEAERCARELKQTLAGTLVQRC
jgi:hypothetical protein